MGRDQNVEELVTIRAKLCELDILVCNLQHFTGEVTCEYLMAAEGLIDTLDDILRWAEKNEAEKEDE